MGRGVGTGFGRRESLHSSLARNASSSVDSKTGRSAAHSCAHAWLPPAERFRDGREFDRAVVRGSIHALLGLLLRDTNAPCPTNPIPESTDDWKAWLDQTLTIPAFADVKAAAGEFLSWYGHLDTERAARQLWVFCHGPNDSRGLHQFALQYDDWFIYDRLATIMPSDRLEEWDWRSLYGTRIVARCASVLPLAPRRVRGGSAEPLRPSRYGLGRVRLSRISVQSTGGGAAAPVEKKRRPAGLASPAPRSPPVCPAFDSP